MSVGAIVGLIISTYFVGLLMTLYIIHRVPSFYEYHQQPGDDSMITAVFWPVAAPMMLFVAAWRAIGNVIDKLSVPSPFELMKDLGDKARMKNQ